MALTMTRTRTQTTLTKLATLVADLHGEQAFLAELQQTAPPNEVALKQALEQRQLAIGAQLSALYVTVRQFDPDIAPEDIGHSEGWRKRIGRQRTFASFRKQYLQLLAGT